MRLRDIPKEDLERIRKYIKENEKILPVKSNVGGMDLIKGIKIHFGYDLSAPQIYKLRKGIRTYRVNLPEDVAEDLERRYGSVGKAIKKLAPLIAKPKELSGRVEEMWKILLDKGKVTDEEFYEIFKDWDDKYQLLRELFKLGFAHREGNKIVATPYKWNPLLSLSGLF